MSRRRLPVAITILQEDLEVILEVHPVAPTEVVKVKLEELIVLVVNTEDTVVVNSEVQTNLVESTEVTAPEVVPEVISHGLPVSTEAVEKSERLTLKAERPILMNPQPQLLRPLLHNEEHSNRLLVSTLS